MLGLFNRAVALHPEAATARFLIIFQKKERPKSRKNCVALIQIEFPLKNKLEKELKISSLSRIGSNLIAFFDAHKCLCCFFFFSFGFREGIEIS